MPDRLAADLHWALSQLHPNRPNADRIKRIANELIRLRELRDNERAALAKRDEALEEVKGLRSELADLRGRYSRLDEELEKTAQSYIDAVAERESARRERDQAHNELERLRATRTTGGIPPACDDGWKNQAMPVIEEHEQSAPPLKGATHA